MCLGLKLTAKLGDIELLNWNFLDVCQGTQAVSSVKSQAIHMNHLVFFI